MQNVDDDKRFITFSYHPWGKGLIQEMKLNNIKFSLSYMNKYEIDDEKRFNDCDCDNNDNTIKINISEGYVIKVKSKLLACIKYVNIKKEYFDNLYNEISGMDFEKLASDSFTGYDGSQTEIKIGIHNGLNKYYKKLGLWSPPCVEDKESLRQIEKLIKFEEEIKQKINFKKWYENTLLKEFESYILDANEEKQ